MGLMITPFEEKGDEIKIVPRRLRSFEGRIDHVMQRILSGKDRGGTKADARRIPLSVRELMYERLHNPNEHDASQLDKRCFTSADVCIGEPGGSGAIVCLYSHHLVRDIINSLSPVSSYPLTVHKETYREIKKEAFVFSGEDLEYLACDSLAIPDKREALWKHLLGDDLYADTLDSFEGGDIKDVMGVNFFRFGGIRPLDVQSRSEHYKIEIGVNRPNMLVGMLSESWK